jgi:hypothetical protein
MSAYHAQFLTFPAELQVKIHGLALERSPRIVKVEIRDGRVVPKTRPPALLHGHRDSRTFVLEIYKPWLPQFAGRTAHVPYHSLLKRYRLSKILRRNTVSYLDAVCFDMERDVLLCRTRGQGGRPLYRFGRIEECCLKKLAVNIDGWLKFPWIVDELRKAKNLDTLFLFQDVVSDGMYYKMERISDGLKRSAGKDRVKPKVRVPNYVAPLIRKASTSQSDHLWDSISQPHVRIRRDITPHVGSIVEAPGPTSTWSIYKCPACSTPISTRSFTEVEIDPTQKASSRKRKADTDPEAVLTSKPRSSEWAKRRIMWTRAQERRREILEANSYAAPAQSLDPAVMKNKSTVFKMQSSNRAAPSNPEVPTSASPQSEASPRSSPGPFSDTDSVPDEPAESEGEDSGSSDSESDGSRSESPDLQDAEEVPPERTPRLLHAHRFNFDINATELLVEWDGSPEMNTWEWVPKDDLLLEIPLMIAAFISNNPALEAGTPVRLHERNSGSVGFDFLVEFEGYPREIYWTWVPEFKMQARVPGMVDEWMAENASEFGGGGDEENVDEQILAEQNYAENIRTGEDEDNHVDDSAQVADAGDADVKEKEDEDIADEESPLEYTPKRFVAQRDTPDGPEILVEWEGWPDEKDWTWEPESNLLEDTPKMVKAWKASRKAKKVSKVYEVDSILGKRKVRGDWNYVVKWKGFSKDEATSLEPCEKLRVDVPDLVVAFENRKPKRGRPKKVSAE